MNRREDTAAELFCGGCGCAQAVSCAFADVLGTDEKTLLGLTAAFGGGFARLRRQCGAVSGMGVVIGGVLTASGADKARVYAVTREAVDEFERLNGTSNCAELLKDIKNLTTGGDPDPRTEEYYGVRPCAKLVVDAVRIAEKIVEREKKPLD